MELTPDDLRIADRYKLLIGTIVPRPIALVSTMDAHGRTNLAPFSFFNGVGSNPMTLLFCPANRPDGSMKDTLRNALPADEGGTGEFVVNIPSESIARQMACCAEELDASESEFDLCDLHEAASVRVRPPRVAEARVCFECQTLRVIRTNPGSPAGGNIVIGRVVHVHVDDAIINERFHTDPDALRPIGRMGGLTYCRTGDRFELPMGRAALDAPIPES